MYNRNKIQEYILDGGYIMAYYKFSVLHEGKVLGEPMLIGWGIPMAFLVEEIEDYSNGTAVVSSERVEEPEYSKETGLYAVKTSQGNEWFSVDSTIKSIGAAKLYSLQLFPNTDKCGMTVRQMNTFK